MSSSSGEEVEEIVEVVEEEEGEDEEVEIVEVIEEVEESDSGSEQEEEDEKKQSDSEEEVSDKEDSDDDNDEEEESSDEEKKKPKKKKKKPKREEEDSDEEPSGDRSLFIDPPINLIPQKRKKKGAKGKEFTDEQKQEIAEEAREMRRIYKKLYTIDSGCTEAELMGLLKRKKITPLMLLPKAPSDIYAQTAFIYACMKGYRKTAMYLYKKRWKDSDPNAAEAKALRWMCGMKDPDIKLIAMMVKEKERCTLHNRSNMALINACREGHAKIVEMLIKAKIGGKLRKVGVSAGDKDGQALIYAVASGKPMIVKLILGMKTADPTLQQFAAVKQASKSLGDNISKFKKVETKKAKNEKKKQELIKRLKENIKNFSIILKMLLLDARMEEHLHEVIKQ